MATKNLARTLIEGGRASYARYVLQRGTRIDRRVAARYCNQARYADDVDDIDRGLPDRRRWLDWDAYNHADCFNPMHNWIKSKIGCRWSEAYSELAKKYDRRRLRNQHLIDHVISAVGWRRHVGAWRYFGEHIDADGIVRDGERYDRIISKRSRG